MSVGWRVPLSNHALAIIQYRLTALLLNHFQGWRYIRAIPDHADVTGILNQGI